jgi:predicted metalloprotease with PDZ domain
MLFHEFNPIGIHWKIQYFDYNMQKMSEHLWMYEGVTEYFANLFQITKDWLLRNSIHEFQRRLKEQNNERQYVFHYRAQMYWHNHTKTNT